MKKFIKATALIAMVSIASANIFIMNDVKEIQNDLSLDNIAEAANVTGVSFSGGEVNMLTNGSRCYGGMVSGTAIEVHYYFDDGTKYTQGCTGKGNSRCSFSRIINGTCVGAYGTGSYYFGS